MKEYKVEVNCVEQSGRLIQKYDDGLQEGFCTHGITLRWSCKKCEDFLINIKGKKD